MSVDDRFQQCQEQLAARGQEHVFRWWDELSEACREQLLNDVQSVPWATVDRLVDSHVLSKPAPGIPPKLEPAPVYPRQPAPGQQELYAEAIDAGRELIAANKVAAFTVAGGQGTRLGVDGPKGAVGITPLRRKSLFQLFAEMLIAARARYGARIAWYIMTSQSNHRQTVDFFEEHDYFGLPSEDVMMFSQGMLPSFNFDGKLVMADKHRLVLAPDGHGGSLQALVASGALQRMRNAGAEIVSYFQVDNPLVRPIDELFIGLHRRWGSEMSTKVTRKAGDFERVGNLCLADGRMSVIEYSNLPEDLARARNPDGSRKFDLGNLAIHLLDVAFVERIAGSAMQLPYHRAEKVVSFIDENGFQRTPPSGSPNAVKLEMFVFDALPLAENPLLLEVDRRDEFSPVKNAEGADSMATSTRDQIRRAARWLEAAGVGIPYTDQGEPDVVVEIAPSYALTVDEVKRKVVRPPRLYPGEQIYVY